jgi:glycosyltransferase involved in cell wall biosynthesis
MPEACYDPVRLRYHGWKKWLVGPIERWCLRRCDRIVATCEAEKEWIEKYLGKRCPAVEVSDIKRFFELGREFGSDGKMEAWRRGFQPRQMGDQNANSEATLTRQDAASPNDGGDGAKLLTRQDAASPKGERDSLHILYLGRRHPLKGVEYLEQAVAELNSNPVNPVNPVQNSSTRLTSSVLSRHSLRSAWSLPYGSRPPTRGGYASQRLCVRFVSNAFGEEKERVWDWCDVLVLPTLSENFGLVIAEALERGKRVITTDGAPAWGEELTGLTGFTGLYSGYEGRLIYLKGYRDGTDEERVELLKKAIDMLKHDGNMV